MAAKHAPHHVPDHKAAPKPAPISNPSAPAFQFIKPISPLELQRGPRDTVISRSKVWIELTQLVHGWANNNAPSLYEVGASIDFSDPAVKADLAGSDNPQLAIASRLRAMLKDLKLQDKIEVRRPGDKILLVGM